ncbi:SPFH domain-containing protein [Pseudofulvimonas gallinarii]|jgi:regulator of protease activity HflC (stomatin/prohibitin superfamily)|uniref:SPFH domain/Band 7 family protein n=1 Tax=Pseudofulvimonas gallinarii TaxID=634155 RepID=A0A4R3LLQ4_9GAMM|nr:SPFH domain-containing protein [Pseudofulvimonas gallinarii]TCT01243.1 SPFH domain/Band 7 family protein [Pseudofulvimonas gallinarii]THD15006.1 hypothetical protein B1808_00965 [Pseudofulvimonas gallinarii]
MSHERSVKATHGLIALPLLVATIPASIYGMVWAAHQSIGWLVIASAIVCFATFVSLFGLFTVEPNQGVVLTLFGRYVGTCRETGLRFANPFYSKKKISQRVRNFESGRLKVNELEGSPIEIAAVVVWQVVDTYEAAFEVDDYENFVQIQSESALRQMATRYPYDMHEGVEIALRSHGEEIARELRREIQDRLAKAGVEVIEARISHLAYAQEIAQAMLQRQQAGAIIAARARIVEGAVGMVHMALEQLRQGGQVELDEERKAAMISNLLVVLCSDRAAQPVINSGSLY